MATNIYDASKYPIQLIYDNNTLNGVTSGGTLGGEHVAVNLSPQHKAVGIKNFPVEAGKTYDIKITNAPSLLGVDGSTVYTYDTFNCIWFLGAGNYGGIYRELVKHYARDSTGKYYVKFNDNYQGTRDFEEFCYQETDSASKVVIYDGNDKTRSNSPTSSGAAILTHNTNYLRIKVISDEIKYISLMICPKQFAKYCINSLVENISASTTVNGDSATTLFSAMQTALTIEEVEETASKVYVRGNAITNATSYELFEKSGSGTYTALATKDTIDFEVSAMGLSVGNHTFVVKAKADGYDDSDYSNEVTAILE